jgi:hypothetical protein
LGRFPIRCKSLFFQPTHFLDFEKNIEQLPDNPKNGTANATTLAIQIDGMCETADLVSILTSTPTSLTASATFKGCTQNYSFDLGAIGTKNGSVNVFGSGAFDCTFSNGTRNFDLVNGPQYGPVSFWIFDVEPTRTRGYVAVCDPKMIIWNATASIDLATQALLSAAPLNQITGDGNNVTGPPLNGVPMNG